MKCSVIAVSLLLCFSNADAAFMLPIRIAGAVDSTAPTITNVTSDKANGTYDTDAVIDIDLTASEAISGSALVTLETGTTDRSCTAVFSASTTASCDYPVQFGDSSADLTVKTISGTLTDGAGNPMTDFVPATNLAANKELVVDGVTSTNGTADIALPTMTASDVTSRTNCVTPCAVIFDVKSTTSGLTSQPFHELLYQWNFGDPVAGAAGTCTDGDPQPREAGQGSYCTGALINSTYDSKNYAEGPVAAHVFESAGTYTAQVTASQGDSNFNGSLESTEYKRASVNITVTAADTQWASNTACISNDGSAPVAGVNGCPSGATGLYDNSDADAALATALGTNGCGTGVPCKRVLWQRGGTYTFSTSMPVSVSGPGMIGAFGSGAKPIFSSTGSPVYAFTIGNSTFGVANDWRFVDLKCLYNTSVSNSACVRYSGWADNTLLLRVDAAFTNLVKLAPGEIVSGSTNRFDGIFVFDSTLNRLPDASGNNAIFLGNSFRTAIVGNHIDTQSELSPNSEHMIRTYTQIAVQSHNTLEGNASNNRTAITNRSFAWAGDTAVPAGTYSGYGVVSQNRVFDTTSALGWGRTNASQDDRVQHVIFERNFTQGTQGMVRGAGQYFTIRNNIHKQVNGSTQYSNLDFLGAIDLYNNSGGTQTGLCPGNTWSYNNTAYTAVAAPHYGFTWGDMPSPCYTPSVTVFMTQKNNLLYAPSGTNSVTEFYQPASPSNNNIAGQSTLTSTNMGNKSTNPSFTTSPPSALADFTPQSGSYANGAGTSVPVWNDFYGNWQPVTRDLGAVVH